MARYISQKTTGNKMKNLVLTFLFGVAAGLILSLWWRAAQVHMTQKYAGSQCISAFNSNTVEEK